MFLMVISYLFLVGNIIASKELISPSIDNIVHQATQLFIILLKTKKLKIVEDDIFNALVQTPTRVQRP